tara:strand:+ start:747 stop:986 length:240 start_codon:yes stop_codon:yes gene_type:complete
MVYRYRELWEFPCHLGDLNGIVGADVKFDNQSEFNCRSPEFAYVRIFERIEVVPLTFVCVKSKRTIELGFSLTRFIWNG